jgi:uncharacterized protein DUF4279
VSDKKWPLADLQDQVRESAAAQLTVYSELPSAVALAEAISLEADEQWSKGDMRAEIKAPVPITRISFGSHLAEARSPTDHVAALVERLRPCADEIRALVAHEGTSAVLWVVEHVRSATAGFANVEAYVRPEDLQTLAAMGVSIAFDAYVCTDDDA